MDISPKPQFLKLKDLIEESRIAYEAGNKYALLSVFEYLRVMDANIPEWVKKGISEQLFLHFQVPQKISKGGPQADDLKILTGNKKHYQRWILVNQYRKNGLTLEKAILKAADTLSDIRDAKDPETIKKSYRQVEKAIKNPAEVWKFIPLRPLDWSSYIPDLPKNTHQEVKNSQ